MRSPGRSLITFATSLLFFIVLAELGSYVALLALGESSKTFSEIYDPTGNSARFKGKCEDYIKTLELNPYLGFTPNRKCSGPDYRVNNLGLLNQDVEFMKATHYPVGIFGGSVAAQFAGSTDTPQIERILNKCFNSPSGKPFIVYNFSGGAWKHPQQEISLTLYGDYINIAISIEGFNEHWAFMPGVNWDIILPPSNYSSLLNGDYLADFYFNLDKLNGGSFSKSNTVKLFTLLFRKNLERRSTYSKLIEKYAFPPSINSHDLNAKRYAGFIKSFDAIASSKNIYSLFVLQPAPINKPLTNAEIKVVAPLNYRQQYSEIASLLKDNARAFIDLSDLFRKTERDVFKDEIHFVTMGNNSKSYGNFEMARNIARKLLSDKVIFEKDDGEDCMASEEPGI
jgi:hypothetical protein